MAAGLLSLRFISSAFDYSIHWLDRPTVFGISLMMMAAIGYFITLLFLSKTQTTSRIFKAILLFGIFLRIIWFGSTPIYEDDFYRYFFDGQMSINGLNPYEHSPSDALPPILPATIEADLNSASEAEPKNPTLIQIAETGPVGRVAYPYVRTIYPPVTQVFFALSQYIQSWHLDTWRGLLFMFEIATLWLSITLLKLLRKPSWQIAIYWLNPLVITETMNAGHMDIILLPFLLSAVILFVKMRVSMAGSMLAGAVGVKIWPLMLAPVFFANYIKTPKKLILASIPFALITLFLLLPQAITKFDSDAGLVTYSQNWHVNAFLFSWLETVFVAITDDAAFISRLVIGAIIISVIVLRTFKHAKTVDQTHDTNMLTQTILILTASLFLLSPTGYPWYYIWLIPWLTLHPSRPLLLLTVTLPLYDLRYPLSLNEDDPDVFNRLIVPLEFLPTLLWLLIDYIRNQIGKRHMYD
ncbi:hypothetical protein [Kordiimonas sp. SCSIO 12610]|uniref:hypothetical protein n=1 Tax=Kordiimonas sp. SCSIO 12610 TaxID=2829597 RepID=UPI00210864DE|nr:hypothetical protein [Kordiimonas sp. SCSIO 12610]UTW55915.1 DUF2029 domain-containing protein [Kordiimonas sp. SCSIO 12610]